MLCCFSRCRDYFVTLIIIIAEGILRDNNRVEKGYKIHSLNLFPQSLISLVHSIFIKFFPHTLIHLQIRIWTIGKNNKKIHNIFARTFQITLIIQPHNKLPKKVYFRRIHMTFLLSVSSPLEM